MQENFGRQEQNFESHYNEILETLAQKYEEKIQALGEKKKEKLESLYGQLVSCGENLETCKELMETIEEMCHQEKVDFLKVSNEVKRNKSKLKWRLPLGHVSLPSLLGRPHRLLWPAAVDSTGRSWWGGVAPHPHSFT